MTMPLEQSVNILLTVKKAFGAGTSKLLSTTLSWVKQIFSGRRQERGSHARILTFIVAFTGFMVMAGWVLDIALLKSISPHWVTMKFSTALCFFLSGVMLYFISKSPDKNPLIAFLLLPATVLSIFLLMATLLASSLLDVHTGIENLFVSEGERAIMTTIPGRPSVGTMIGFILTAFTGIATIYNPAGAKRHLVRVGAALSIIGLMAVVGYVMDSPVLYFMYEGWSTAMALHTAILFTLLGIEMIFIARQSDGRTWS